MKVLTEQDVFLRSFFDIELFWLSDRTYQVEAWSTANEDLFVECLMLYSEAWSVIAEDRKNYKLSHHQLTMLDNLYEMIKAFEREQDIPENAAGHRALLENPAWKKIQQYAKNIRDGANPTLP